MQFSYYVAVRLGLCQRAPWISIGNWVTTKLLLLTLNSINRLVVSGVVSWNVIWIIVLVFGASSSCSESVVVGTGRVRGKTPAWNYTFGQIDTSIVVALFTTGVKPREEVMPTVTYCRTTTMTAAIWEQMHSVAAVSGCSLKQRLRHRSWVRFLSRAKNKLLI